jgi:hypothetical protein
LGEQDGVLFLAMEWIDGIPLNQLMKAAKQRGGVPTTVATRIVMQASAGLHAAHELTTHRYFAWLERHLQRMKYSGPLGLAAIAQRQSVTRAESTPEALPAHLLALDPGLPLPDYYATCDIHQQPGGLAQELGAHIYREAVTGGVVGTDCLHERFAIRIVADRDVARVVDLGCGFGRSTWAFASAAPRARVDGIDVAASCVSLAAHDTPGPLRHRVAFRQAFFRFVHGDT